MTVVRWGAASTPPQLRRGVSPAAPPTSFILFRRLLYRSTFLPTSDPVCLFGSVHWFWWLCLLGSVLPACWGGWWCRRRWWRFDRFSSTSHGGAVWFVVASGRFFCGCWWRFFVEDLVVLSFYQTCSLLHNFDILMELGCQIPPWIQTI